MRRRRKEKCRESMTKSVEKTLGGTASGVNEYVDR